MPWAKGLFCKYHEEVGMTNVSLKGRKLLGLQDATKEEIQLIQEVKKKNPIFEEQQILRILRNQYLHWSANKDWFGMQPAPGRKRDTY